MIFHLGLFLICGSVINDVVLIKGSTWSSMAKIMFLTGLLFMLFDGIPKPYIKKHDIPVVIYVAFLVIIGIFAPLRLSAEWVGVTTSLMIGIVGYFVFSKISAKRQALVPRYYLVWVALSIFLGFIQTFLGVGYFTDRIFETTLVAGLNRASGFTSDPNYFALTCLIALPLVNNTIIFAKRQRLFCVALLVIGIVFSGSRSALLVLLSYLLFFVLIRKAGITSKVFIIGGLVFAGMAGSDYAPDSIKMVFDPSAYEESAGRNSLQDRALAAVAAIRVGQQNPLFGYGLGGFRSHPTNFHAQVSHNTYLELFAESGLFGLSVYLLLLGYFVYSLRKLDKGSEAKYVGLSIIFMFSLMSIFLVVHYSRLLFFVIGLLAGLLYLADLPKKRVVR